MASNDNLDITAALGIKKRKDAQEKFSHIIEEFHARGLETKAVTQCLAAALIGQTPFQYERMTYMEISEALSRVMTARAALHDIYMQLRREIDKFEPDEGEL